MYYTLPLSHCERCGRKLHWRIAAHPAAQPYQTCAVHGSSFLVGIRAGVILYSASDARTIERDWSVGGTDPS